MSPSHFLTQLASSIYPDVIQTSISEFQNSKSGVVSKWATDMARSGFLKKASVFLSLQALTTGKDTTSSSTTTGTISAGSITTSTMTNFKPVFTIPAAADEGANLVPNILDPKAVDAQDVCPGYKAEQVREDERGISAVLSLAGAPCNVYGNDVGVLDLKVEFQTANRLAINISPTNLVSWVFWLVGVGFG
jgi:alpha-glucosidase